MNRQPTLFDGARRTIDDSIGLTVEMTQHQQQLPFGAAEGTYAERKALLWVALRQCGAGPQVVRFCEWLFDSTDGGLGQPIVASYRELATKPWLMNCSRSTLKRAVADGLRYGLVACEEVWDAVGRNVGNRYSLDRAGIRKLVSQAAGREPVGVQNEPVPVHHEPLGVQNEPVPVHHEPLGVQNEPPKRGREVASASPSLIPAGETPRAPCPRTRGPNEPMIPMKEAQASEPTPMEESLVSSLVGTPARGLRSRDVSPVVGKDRGEPTHASQAVADLLGSLPTPEQYAARRAALKARIHQAISDPDCHDSLAGRAADLVVLHGIPVSEIDVILDSLTRARRQNAFKKGAGQYANGAFRRLARQHGIAWGKADDG